MTRPNRRQVAFALGVFATVAGLVSIALGAQRLASGVDAYKTVMLLVPCAIVAFVWITFARAHETR